MDQQFIIFAKEDTEASTRLQAAMSVAVRASDVSWCDSPEDFLGKFRAPHEYTAAILLIENCSDFTQLLSNHDLFEGLRIFLVLSDNSSEAIALAHKMAPRFITYTDSNFTEELTAIIRKLAVMT